MTIEVSVSSHGPGGICLTQIFTQHGTGRQWIFWISFLERSEALGLKGAFAQIPLFGIGRFPV